MILLDKSSEDLVLWERETEEESASLVALATLKSAHEFFAYILRGHGALQQETINKLKNFILPLLHVDQI